MKIYTLAVAIACKAAPRLLVIGALCVLFSCPFLVRGQDEAARNLTPRQREIQKQQQRLSSTEVEDRRDAIMRLGSMRHRDASRAALPGVTDVSPIVRATAAKAILSLPADEVVGALVPLLTDKDVFVRQEATYALGKTHSRAAVAPLQERLLSDKYDGVRAAAAVALGEIADDASVPVLIQVISGPTPDRAAKRSRRKEKNEFVLRAAAVALGQIRNRAAVPALLALLAEEKLASDVKREAARALGLIGDPAAVPGLQAASVDNDPHLSRTAQEALRRIRARG